MSFFAFSYMFLFCLLLKGTCRQTRASQRRSETLQLGVWCNHTTVHTEEICRHHFKRATTKITLFQRQKGKKKPQKTTKPCYGDIKHSNARFVLVCRHSGFNYQGEIPQIDIKPQNSLAWDSLLFSACHYLVTLFHPELWKCSARNPNLLANKSSSSSSQSLKASKDSK